MDKKIKIFVGVIIVAILIVIFFPRECGSTSSGLMGGYGEVDYWKECKCVGVKFEVGNRGGIFNEDIKCAGIPAGIICHKNAGPALNRTTEIINCSEMWKR
jgi:hypothetical protein